MFDIFLAYTCDLGTEVNYFAPRFYQSVKNYIAVEIDDTDTNKSFAFFSFDSLTTEWNYFALSIPNGH